MNVPTHVRSLRAAVNSAMNLSSSCRATVNASAFAYGASKLAIKSYDKYTPDRLWSISTVTGAYDAASGTCLTISIPVLPM